MSAAAFGVDSFGSARGGPWLRSSMATSPRLADTSGVALSGRTLAVAPGASVRDDRSVAGRTA